jgi:hypothetical protein
MRIQRLNRLRAMPGAWQTSSKYQLFGLGQVKGETVERAWFYRNKYQLKGT